MASEPIKYLWQDEKGKYKRQSDEEADSERLSLRRTISYGQFARVYGSTTPTVKDAPGWRSWDDSTKCQFHVPCPECDHVQVMYFGHEDRRWFESTSEWDGGIVWSKEPGLTKKQRINSARYKCAACSALWTNAKKNIAVAHGKWIAKNPDATNYCAHLGSWYAKWVTLSDIVSRYLDAYKDDEARHDFLNSDCAVPYEIRGKKIEESALRRHVLHGHHEGQIPAQAVTAYLTADVHDDHIRYRVRAWASDLTSWGVDEGQIPPDLWLLDHVLNRKYTTKHGTMGISNAIIDSAWRTDEVYQYCLRHPGRVWPVKGSAGLREIVKYHNQHVIADPEKGLTLSGDVLLIYIDDHRWKDQLFSRLQVTLPGPGAWYLEEEVSDEYLHQMAGEQKVDVTDKKGRSKVEWRQLHANHALDCEKYQLVATQVFQLTAMAQVQVAESAEPVINPYTGKVIGG